MQVKNIFLPKIPNIACAWAFLALGALVIPTHAFSQAPVSRSIPSDTFWGNAKFTEATSVTIEGRIFIFAPAVFIRNERNLLITPIEAIYADVPPLVRFGINQMGQVDRIWFLTDEERDSTLKKK